MAGLLVLSYCPFHFGMELSLPDLEFYTRSLIVKSYIFHTNIKIQWSKHKILESLLQEEYLLLTT